MFPVLAEYTHRVITDQPRVQAARLGATESRLGAGWLTEGAPGDNNWLETRTDNAANNKAHIVSMFRYKYLSLDNKSHFARLNVRIDL